MGNYGLEYKNYYEGLKNKSSVRVDSTYSRVEDYIPGRGTRYGYNDKDISKRSILNYIVNMFTLQLVGTILMFLFVFGARYSNDNEFDKYYSYFKNSINKEVDYSGLKADVQAFKISDFVDDIKSSVKTLREKIESNPLN